MRVLGPLDLGAHADAGELHLITQAMVRLIARGGIHRSALLGQHAAAVGAAAVAADRVPEALAPGAAHGEHSAAVPRRGEAAKRQHKQRAQRRQAARDDAHRALDQAPDHWNHLCPLAPVSLHSPLSALSLLSLFSLGRGGED